MSEEQKTNVPLVGEIFVEGEAPPQYYQAFLNAQKKSEDAAAKSEAAAGRAEESMQNAKADADRSEDAAARSEKAAEDTLNAAQEADTYFEKSNSTNLLNPDELEIGAYMSVDGRKLTSASHALTGYIPVTDGNTLSYQQTRLWGDFARVISDLTFVTAFDKDKNVIPGSGQDGGTVYAVPSGVAFVRVSFGYSESYEDRAICNATEVIPYEEYYEVKWLKHELLDDEYIAELARKAFVQQDLTPEQQAQAGAFAAKEIENYFESEKSTNLLNSDELEIGKYMSPSGGLSSSSSHALTGYITVTEGDTLSYQQTKKYGDFARVISGLTFVTAFDADKNVMPASGQDGGSSYTVPGGVAFVRVSFGYSESYEDRAICNAAEVIPYEEYYEVKRLKHEWLDGEYVAELARKVYKNPCLETSGTLASGGTLTLASDIDVKKNASQTFFAKFKEWADDATLTVGHGLTDFMASYAVIDKTNITTYYYNGTVLKQEAHGLTLSDFVSVNIMVKNNESASIHLATATGSYKLSSTNWYGCNGDIYAKSTGLNLTDCQLSWTSADLLSDVWVFGDSYLNISDVTRFPYYIIHEFGYDKWLACGYGGASAESELLAFEKLLALGTPKYAVWTLGMNNMDSGAINSGYQTATEQFIAMCTENSIIPIICTIPSTGSRDNSYKNAWVKASGCRYIDFADAVEKQGGVWYDGMLSADGVHPAALGAVTLAHRFIRDFPEIAMCK